MSQQPPLPPGPPPPRTDYYRPGTGPDTSRYDNRYPPPPGRDYSFQFSANPSYPSGGMSDSYRDQGRRNDRQVDSFRPSQGDTYRPPQGDFTFRQDAPRSIIENSRGMEYQPRPARAQNNGFNRQDNFNQRNGRPPPSRGRGGYRGRGGFVPLRAAERPMLQSNREPTPELMKGMDENNEAVKFRDVEDLSESDAAMDLSSDNQANTTHGGPDSDQPRKKQARTLAYKPADGESVPKWSNPDPYTALPPPDESQGNKKDILEIIRKHKVAPNSEEAPKQQAAADDFISFDLDEEESVNGEQVDEPRLASPGNGMPGAPKAPRLLIDKSANPELGSRKRTIDDAIKDERPRQKQRAVAVANPSDRPQTMGRRSTKDSRIHEQWIFNPRATNISPSPWCIEDHSRTLNMGTWLHKEIVDFYEYTKPRLFEEELRGRVVANLQSLVHQQWGDGFEVRAFGSFPTGLYLPTSDIDIVVTSEQFRRSGIDDKSEAVRLVRRFERLLKSSRTNPAKGGSIVVIKGARVPLVKYVDRETNINIDVSFENSNGIVALETYEAWKNQYPAMPIIVTLIKQFLAMRKLNDPANGGIGGFTVTCLVISLLQNLPSVQSGNMIPEHHLNEILMEFLNLYGNSFNAKTTAISTNPPGYVSKNQSHTVYKQSQISRLSVIDPNDPNNDLTRGAAETTIILECFSKAYYALQERMVELHHSGLDVRKNQSILGVILGGNYSSFEVPRRELQRLHSRTFR